MKTIRTKGRGAKQAERVLAALEKRGGTALDSVLPAVRRIVGAVRKQGDRALLRYASQFDELTDTSNLRITPEEMQAAWEATANSNLAVLVLPSQGATAAIDRSMPVWTVKIGQLGSPTADFPPPQTHSVTTAWFAGDFVPV